MTTDIESQIAAFFAAGRKIEYVEPGVTAAQFKTYHELSKMNKLQGLKPAPRKVDRAFIRAGKK